MNVHSADAFAFDFAEEDDLDPFIESLEDETGFESLLKDGVPSPFGGSGMSFNHLGGIQNLEDSSFTMVYVSVVRFGSIPDVAALLLTGDVDEENCGEAETLFDAQQLQDELSELWSDLFSEFPSTLQRSSPLTLFSGQIEIPNLEQTFELPDENTDVDTVAEYDPFVESIRSESFCRSLGIEFRGLMSVETDREEFLTLTAQTVWTSSGEQIQHDSYAVIEFLPEESSMLTDFDLGPVMSSLSGPSRSAGRIQRMMALLFYFYWFQKQSEYQKLVFGQTLREMPVGVGDDHEIDELIEQLREEESDFYKEYATFLDRADSARTLLSRLTNVADREIGIPLTDYQDPFVQSHIDGIEYEFDYDSGVLSVLVQDTERVVEDAKHEYDELKDRYEIVLGELNQQLDLIISQQNRKLTESSVEIQEDMKDLTESSVKLQENVNKLTKWVAFLTLVLVAEAFGLFGVVTDVAQWAYEAVIQFL